MSKKGHEKLLKYIKCVVIVHGKTEFMMVKHIYTKLHLRVKIFDSKAKNGDISSIEIKGLKKLLKKEPFISREVLAEKYGIQYDEKTKELKNFSLFIIMDIDGCGNKIKSDFINKTMFKGHPLEKYIVPIYSDPKLDDILKKAGIVTKVVKKNKGAYYKKIFPVHNGPKTLETVEEVELIDKKLQGINNTNIRKFLEYCLQQEKS